MYVGTAEVLLVAHRHIKRIASPLPNLHSSCNMPAVSPYLAEDCIYSLGVCPTDQQPAPDTPPSIDLVSKRRCAAPDFPAHLRAAMSPRAVDNRRALAVDTPPEWAWHRISPAPADPILHVVELYRADPSAHKLNLSVGAYRDAQGRATELRCIAQATRRLAQRAPDHAYLPLVGHAALVSSATSLVFADSIAPTRVAAVQSLSGSGALRIALELCRKTMDAHVALVSRPTWPNHVAMAAEAGLSVREYAYYNSTRHTVDVRAMVAALDSAPRGAVVILQACAHNPTGADLDACGWRAVLAAVRRRALLPLFDIAYQGLASGDMDADAAPVRMFVREGVPVIAALSLSKTMGLYNSRVGALLVALPAAPRSAVDAVRSRLVWLTRAAYSSPPARGARLAAEVLSDTSLRQSWALELREMAMRARAMRMRLQAELALAEQHRTKGAGRWDFVGRGVGMFALLGLDDMQVAALRESHHIYLAAGGRVNVCGLTNDTVRRVARAIVNVVHPR